MESSNIHSRKSNFIGSKYQVYGVLGHGGFGVVYLVYCYQTESVYALKTFRDEYMQDKKTKEQFAKEASVWVNLERHPYLVRAHYVDEVEGRLYIAMEYIAPNAQGLNSLEGYLKRQPPDTAQSLHWSIQFCYGMIYAYSKGVRCHRDIKPANIMISNDKTVKITDFGLAEVLGRLNLASQARLSIQDGGVGLSLNAGKCVGTPTHMPPEQFTNAADCDQRSDIYSFGVVLYQMATGGDVPFLVALPKECTGEEMKRWWNAMYWRHCEAELPKVDSPLFSIIQRCLQKKPKDRYQTFVELRGDLERLLQRLFDETVIPPKLEELDEWDLGNKGTSLFNLGRIDEAMKCYNKVFGINPRFAGVWYNKGVFLSKLGHFDEAIECYDKALEINPKFAEALYSKGVVLSKLGRFDEEIECYSKALEVNPKYDEALYSKGVVLGELGRLDEAIECYDKALETNPKYANAWNNKGEGLGELGRLDEAIECYDKALETNPKHSNAWYNKGAVLSKLGRFEEAINCFDRAIEVNPRGSNCWLRKAYAEDQLGKRKNAVMSYRKFIELSPTECSEQRDYAIQRIHELD